jgi:hypothetical protein
VESPGPDSFVWTRRFASSAGMAPAEFSVFFKEQHDSFNRIVRENNVKFE